MRGGGVFRPSYSLAGCISETVPSKIGVFRMLPFSMLSSQIQALSKPLKKFRPVKTLYLVVWRWQATLVQFEKHCVSTVGSVTSLCVNYVILPTAWAIKSGLNFCFFVLWESKYVEKDHATKKGGTPTATCGSQVYIMCRLRKACTITVYGTCAVRQNNRTHGASLFLLVQILPCHNAHHLGFKVNFNVPKHFKSKSDLPWSLVPLWYDWLANLTWLYNLAAQFH